MINFRLRPDMLTLFPKQPLAVFKDNTMPRIDVKKFDAPAKDRVKDRVNVAKWKLDRVKRETLPALLRRQA